MLPRKSQFDNNTLFGNRSSSDSEQEAQDLSDDLKNIEKRIQELEKSDRPVEAESLKAIMADLRKLSERQSMIGCTQKADELEQAREKFMAESKEYEASTSSCAILW